MRFSYVQILLIFLVSATTHSISFVQGSTTFVRRRKKQRTSSKMVATFLQEELIPSVVGAVSFYGTLALSTCLQKSIGVTTADKMLARMIGFPSVCVASVVSVRSVRFTQEIQRDSLSWKDLNKKKLLSFHPPPHSSNQFYNVGFVSLPKEDVHACILGLGAFKLLGGRFWGIAPSSYAGPGSYARNPIPATEKYIQGQRKVELGNIYKRYGCHVCGSKVGNPVGDHNPPVSIGKLMSNPTYAFYPHCGSCSNHQGGIMGSASNEIMELQLPNWKKIRLLRAAGGGTNAYNHGFQPRIYHLTGSICTILLGNPNDSLPGKIIDSCSITLQDFKKRFQSTLRRK